jgi:cytosine/adenosine deaminase-related metal-dependent hydrolase
LSANLAGQHLGREDILGSELRLGVIDRSRQKKKKKKKKEKMEWKRTREKVREWRGKGAIVVAVGSVKPWPRGCIDLGP